MRVRLIVSDTGRGLRRDAELLSRQIRHAGLTPETILCPPRSERITWIIDWVDRVKRRLPVLLRTILNRLQCLVYGKGGERDLLVTIHLQRVHSRYVAGRHENWLIPNAEWYSPNRVQYLSLIDRVLCKTQESAETFGKLHPHAAFIGFSGLFPKEVALSNPSERFRRFLHVAGNNRKKGTATLVKLWKAHPEWPVLDLVIDDEARLPVHAENIRVHKHVDDGAMRRLREECGIALAPSEAEGFGHVLLDAMAWRQLVVTVDAPPMNELVARDRGQLASWTHSRPCMLGHRYFVDADKLGGIIDSLLREEGETLARQADNARQWVLDNHQAFSQRFTGHLETLLPHG